MTGIVTSLALYIFLLLSLFRPYIEVFISQKAKLHDATIRLAAVGLGIVLAVLNDANISHLTFSLVKADVGTGVAAGLAAIFTYHVATASEFDSPAPPADVPPVTAQLAAAPEPLATVPVLPVAVPITPVAEPPIFPPAV